MAGAVHLVDIGNTAKHTDRHGRLAAGLNSAVFVCLVAVALCAPLSTKGAVNAFRAASLLWLISLFSRERRLSSQPLALPLVLFLLLTGISSALSVDPHLSWGRMRTVSLLFLAVVAGQAIRNIRQIKIITSALIVSCLITVIYTGWQYTAGIGVQAVGSAAAVARLEHLGMGHGEILQAVDGKKIRSAGGLLALPLRSPVDLRLCRETPNGLQTFHVTADPAALHTSLQDPGVILVRAHPPRAQGFFKHYFPFSEILVFAGLLIWGFVVCLSASRLRIVGMVAFAATAVVLALTLTRISLVSLAVGALAIVLVGTRGRVRWISLAGFLIIAFAGLFWVQRQRAAPESDPGTQYRLLMWRDSVHMIRAHPIFGVGLDAVAGDWQRWNLEAYRRFGLHSHFHSTPIQLAVECGLPALAVWIWLIVGYAVFLLRLHRRLAPADWFARGLVLGVIGGLAGFVLTGFLQYNSGDAEAMVIFWLLAGLAFALNRRYSLSVPKKENRESI